MSVITSSVLVGNIVIGEVLVPGLRFDSYGRGSLSKIFMLDKMCFVFG